MRLITENDGKETLYMPAGPWGEAGPRGGGPPPPVQHQLWTEEVNSE